MTAIEPRPTDLEPQRHAMVASQLRASGVTDTRVITAMATVPRERYLPDAGALAYRDTAVPVGGGRAMNLPLATARLLDAARLMPTDHVLLIGAATGYAAALVARIAACVVAVESDPALAARARATLADSATVDVVEGPLTAGHAADAPYDVLFVDGAVAALPDALLDQVRPGGRIVTGIVDRGVTRLTVGERSAGGAGLTDFADVDCVVLPGFDHPGAFSF